MKLVLTDSMASGAADALLGHSVDDVAELVGEVIAVKLCQWISKHCNLRQCEDCGNYERTLYQVDEYGELCIECKTNAEEDDSAIT